jgi:hypothetical protein
MTTAHSAPPVTYRPLRLDDLDAVAELIDLAGWGPVAPDTLREWYFSEALEPVVAVAANERDEARGLLAFYPYRVQLFDRIGTGYRGRGMVLAPELRYSTRRPDDAADANDPFAGMGTYALELIGQRGGEFVFGLPHQRVRTRQAARDAVKASSGAPPEDDGVMSEHEFGALKIELVGAPGGRVPLDVVATRRPCTTEYDTLWARARRGLAIECAVVRDAAAITQLRASDLRLECRSRGRSELVGYAVVRDHKEGQLLDILAVDDTAMREVATSVVNWLRAHVDALTAEFLSSLAHPAFAPALRDAGAIEVDWPFALTIYAMDPEPRPELDAARWYVTTGD